MLYKLKAAVLLGMLVFAVSVVSAKAQGGAIDVTDYGAVPNDGVNDAPAIQNAVNAAFEGVGGVILFPPGQYDVNTEVKLVPLYTEIGKDLTLRGMRGAVLKISVGRTTIAFQAGNLGTFTIEDLVFTGKSVPESDPSYWDAKHVIFSNDVQYTNIIRCSFFGIGVGMSDRTSASVVFIGNTDAKIIDTQFDGSLGLYPYSAVVEADNFRGLTVQRATFLDYANFNGEYLSKSHSFVGSWIRAKNGRPFNGNGQRRVVVDDSRFDEGAAQAIAVQDVQWVVIRGISVNVNGSTAGVGVYLRDVGHAKVEQSWFGYASSPRPAIDMASTYALEVVSLEFSEGVFFLRQTGLTKVSAQFCPACIFPTRPKPCLACK